MKNQKLLFVLMLVVSTFLGSIGQLSFKLGIDSASLYTLALYIICGAIAYGFATIIYLYILGRANLSWAYGFVGFSYIFTAILAFEVLGESIGIVRWVGILVIAAGTAFIGTS